MLKEIKLTVAAGLLVLASAASGVALADSLADAKKLSAEGIDMWASQPPNVPVDDIFLPSYRNHQLPDVDGGTATIDLDTWKTLIAEFHKSFSDTKVEIFLQVAEGDYVATRWQFTGTQTGTYLGLAPTDKTISWTGAQVDRFEDGKIAETWVNWDMYGMFKQLGLIE